MMQRGIMGVVVFTNIKSPLNIVGNTLKKINNVYLVVFRHFNEGMLQFNNNCRISIKHVNAMWLDVWRMLS